jgi:hypothetical protein
VNHRPDDSQCLQPASAGSCKLDGGPPSTCRIDMDCADAGSNGRCNQFGVNVYEFPDQCHCVHDACNVDTDCPTGQTCACHGSPYMNGWGNTCMPGNCRVDSDCGPGGYCSPTMRGGYPCMIAGFYCHTPKDQCIDDSDCTTVPNPGCIYTGSYWSCVDSPCGI